MYDILFICKNCGVHLSADDNDVGLQIPCPQCSHDITVPTGDVLFDCPECGRAILAGAETRGQSFHCFYCELEIRVPEKGKDVQVSASLPTREEIEDQLKASRESEEAKVATSEPVPGAKPKNDQFMMTWGDYLAKAGLTDGKEEEEGKAT